MIVLDAGNHKFRFDVRKLYWSWYVWKERRPLHYSNWMKSVKWNLTNLVLRFYNFWKVASFLWAESARWKFWKIRIFRMAQKIRSATPQMKITLLILNPMIFYALFADGFKLKFLQLSWSWILETIIFRLNVWNVHITAIMLAGKSVRHNGVCSTLIE